MRDTRWCRQELAEDCRLDKEHAHICITTPGYRKITPSCGRETMNMFFHDVDPEDVRKSLRYAVNKAEGDARIAACFKDEDAQKIVRFVNTLPEGHVLMVNCEAGVSRSPGVVLALRRYYGGDVNECYRLAYPNEHVANLMRGSLNEINGRKPKPCGNDKCGTSFFVDEITLTFGSGGLDPNGLWDIPCLTCANDYKHDYPDELVWPTDDESVPHEGDHHA